MTQDTHAITLTIQSVNRYAFYENLESWDIKGTIQGLPQNIIADLYCDDQRLASDSFKIRGNGEFYVNARNIRASMVRGDGSLPIVAKTSSGVSNTVTAKVTPNPLPAPTIKSATSLIGTVTIEGTNDLKQPDIEVTLAEQKQITRATSANTWKVIFNNVAQGTHGFTAVMKDPQGILKDSAPARGTVEVSHTPANPLRIISPAQGATVGRTMQVSGDTASGTGPIKVSVGGGAENTALVSGREWSVPVISAGVGPQTIRARNEMTGEVVTRQVEVAGANFGISRIARVDNRYYIVGWGNPGIQVLQVDRQSEVELDVEWQGTQWTFFGRQMATTDINIRASNEQFVHEFSHGTIRSRHPDITYPQNGQEVGRTIEIQGLAYMPAPHEIVITEGQTELHRFTAPRIESGHKGLPFTVQVGPLKPGTHTLTFQNSEKSQLDKSETIDLVVNVK